MTKKRDGGRTAKRPAFKRNASGDRITVYGSLPAAFEADILAFGEDRATTDGIQPKPCKLTAMLVLKGLAAWKAERATAA